MSIILKGLNVNNRPVQRDGHYVESSLNPERVEYQLIVSYILCELRVETQNPVGMANIVAADFNPPRHIERRFIEFRRNGAFNRIYMYRSYGTQ